MTWSTSRPVIILGHGCRLAGVDCNPLLELGVPVLTSWPAADLVDNFHPNYYGRPGVYGQRCANKVFAAADMIVSIGCRLSIWTVGYDFPRPGQRLAMCDADESEVLKFPSAEWANGDIKAFIKRLVSGSHFHGREWQDEAARIKADSPWLEAAHDETAGYITPHRFIARLQEKIRPDEVIVTDCATGNLAAHQILRIRPPQRLMTSGGLGEMGCGLPGAIGAAFASGGEVLCLNTDGSMMLNLQELQTVAHHRLPVKIVVFSNDGYAMIRDTQRNLGYRASGVDRASGVSCPDFVRVAQAFDIAAMRCNLANVDECVDMLFRWQGPMLLDVVIDPAYVWAPKLRPKRAADGTIQNANFAEMEP